VPPLEYALADVEAFYRRQDASEQAWRPGDRVGGHDAASRLGVTYNTFRAFPAAYPADSANPFPAKGADGRYRWRDIETWDVRRPGSGRRDSLPRRGRGARPGEPQQAGGSALPGRTRWQDDRANSADAALASSTRTGGTPGMASTAPGLFTAGAWPS
jgi:hypothetical protein